MTVYHHTIYYFRQLHNSNFHTHKQAGNWNNCQTSNCVDFNIIVCRKITESRLFY